MTRKLIFWCLFVSLALSQCSSENSGSGDPSADTGSADASVDTTSGDPSGDTDSATSGCVDDAADGDSDGVPCALDCDDENPDVYPGQTTYFTVARPDGSTDR